VTLLAFAAAAPLLLGVQNLLQAHRAAIDQYRLPAGGRHAANPPHTAAAAVDTWDRQTDGHRTVT